MALINQNALFDKLQEYIDKKIMAMPYELRGVFEEYGLKEILPFLDEIKIVADNIQAVIDVALVAPYLELIVSPPMLKAILDAADNALIAVSAADKALNSQWIAEAEAMTADSYATEDININVKEYYSNGNGTFRTVVTSNYSSFHWSIMAEAVATGMVLHGLWDPNSGLAPLPLDDPNNPGTPLPLVNGFYWYISADSTDQVTPDPVYGGPFLVDDRIMYLDNDAVPFKPWLRLRDFTRWANIVDVPVNVTNALDRSGAQAGAYMTGDLEVQRSYPRLILNDIGALDRKLAFQLDVDGRYTVDAITDAGAFIQSYLIYEPDAKVFHALTDKMTYDGATVWDANNMGPDSGLDADTVDGIHGIDLIAQLPGNDMALLIQPGTYASNVFVNGPANASPQGTLLITGGKDSAGEKTQYYVDVNNKMYIRTLTLGVPTSWAQMGAMVFDGTVLSISL